MNAATSSWSRSSQREVKPVMSAKTTVTCRCSSSIRPIGAELLGEGLRDVALQPRGEIVRRASAAAGLRLPRAERVELRAQRLDGDVDDGVAEHGALRLLRGDGGFELSELIVEKALVVPHACPPETPDRILGDELGNFTF